MSSLIPIDLGSGRTAHIKEETPYGEIEDARWLEKHWLKQSPDHAKEARQAMCFPIVCVHRWEGMSDDWSWPDMITPLSTDQPAIDARYQSLRRHIGMKTLTKLMTAIQSAMLPDEVLEGN